MLSLIFLEIIFTILKKTVSDTSITHLLPHFYFSGMIKISVEPNIRLAGRQTEEVVSTCTEIDDLILE